MKSLNSLTTSAFDDCTINEFDAPNLNSITINENPCKFKNNTFIVGKKNFEDSPGILLKEDILNEEPDYE